VERYPGLIVHGPLIATLLVDLLRRNVEVELARFAFRAVRPLFDTTSFAVCGVPEGDGRAAKVWAQDAEGFLAMEADAEFGR
jgi:3-methylfumaryl-CoA hydratase